MSDQGKPGYRVSHWLFFRILGLIYLAAFMSFGLQVLGLIGSDGILPARQYLGAAERELGVARFWLLPTLCWLNSSDTFLLFLCWGGAALSLFLVFGVAEAPVLILLWAFYLSLATVSGEFMGFQWDILLTEAGFLAIFFAPLNFRLKRPAACEPSRLVLYLFWWLLFRLTFSSGAVKLASGDESWRTLTALYYHYQTQPLPTWIGWYAHQLPHWCQQVSAGIMFVVELGLPFLIFFPRRARMIGCAGMAGLQLLIMATGNYCFFNLLTLLLCLLLLDDGVWPGRLRERLAGESSQRVWAWPQWILLPVAVLILLLSTMQMARLVPIPFAWPAPLTALQKMAAPLRSVNSYGLFAVMTVTRPEIVIEGSDDGVHWKAYEFKYKPGDLTRPPGFNIPHQPRLDWQMWFAALSHYRNQPWFGRFSVQILRGSPQVLALLKENPFGGQPPQYLRALVYDYRFSNRTVLRAENKWWTRTLKGLYCPTLSLKQQ